jgi:hypothetical protein
MSKELEAAYEKLLAAATDYWDDYYENHGPDDTKITYDLHAKLETAIYEVEQIKLIQKQQ